MTKDEVSDTFLEMVEERVGMGSGAWDCLNPKEIIAEVINVYEELDGQTITI